MTPRPAYRLMPGYASVVACALCALVFMAARPMFRGVPLGGVLDVDPETGAVSVDLGKADLVMKGMKFSVVDSRGHQLALIVAAEVFDDRFWSEALPPGQARAVRAGMQVRWVFTPELNELLKARKADTVKAYRAFVDAYPDSRFIPGLVRLLSEEILRELDPDFYDAWKFYTAGSFEEYVARHPKGGFSSAARAEAESLRKLGAAREAKRLEREKRAAEYEKERHRQEEVKAEALARQRTREMEQMHGKLVNNSSEPVRFVFDPPSMMPPTIVQPGGEYEVSHPEGSYTYKVFGLPAESEEPDLFGGEPEEPLPLAEGTAEIIHDFWTVEYP